MSFETRRTPLFIQLFEQQSELVQQELSAGLLAPVARVSPKFLYDALGSRLFDVITELPEYYPTRTEIALMARHAPAIATALPAGATLVDLGAGNCEKAARLFPSLAPKRYVAVDISADYLHGALNQLQQKFPEMEMLGVGVDFSSELQLPAEAGEERRVFFYPGSSIGNFSPIQAAAFLKQVRAQSQGGGLLIGVDLVKPVEVLQPAYDDALGVTAAFNKNMLLHLNQRIGSNFQVPDWAHVALYNASESRIEMHLQANCDVRVQWPGASRSFKKGERIHTENSYKYTVESFTQLLKAAGFERTQVWQDSQKWFAVFWASE